MGHYAYEHAEEKLDHFATRIRSKTFHRAYQKFKVLIRVFAYCDFSYPNLPTEEQLSWAWEDVELAFKGLGDSILHGCIVQMWSTLKPSEKEFFLSSVRMGFSAAETATPEDVHRRYLQRYRKLAIRDPELGYNYQIEPIESGVTCKEWSNELDPDEHSNFLATLDEKSGLTSLFIQVVASRRQGGGK